MTNLTKIALGNWTKQSVVLGGTGNITLGAVLQYPTVIETVGVNKSFHYVFRAANNTPIEVGVGTLLDAVTLRRDRVYGRMIEGVYTSGDALTPVDIPEGAFIFTAPTAEMLYDLMREQPEIDYGDVSGTETISAYPHSIRAHLTADTTLTLDTDTLPPAGVHHELMIKLTSDEVYASGQTQGYLVTIAGTAINQQGSASASVRTLGAQELHIKLVNISGTDTYEMYVLNRGTNIEYGNISGAVSIDFRHEVITANLTGNATLSPISGTLPNDNVHHEVLLKITTANNPALTAPFQAGYTLTLAGIDFTIDGTTPMPTVRLMGGRELILRLINNGGGTTYRVEDLSEYNHIQNLGVLTGNVALDLRHTTNMARLTGTDAGITLNSVSPSVPLLKPAYFTIINDSTVPKVITINTSVFGITGTPFSQVTLLPDEKLDFTAQRDYASPTEKYALIVFNARSLYDYGNVTGIVDISFQHDCIMANLTGDCTLDVIEATIPTDFRHREVLLKITSDDNPAMAEPFQMGYKVALAGTNFTIDGTTPFPITQVGADGKELALRLTNIGDGTNYRVENISKHHTIQNLGVVSGNVTLDIRHPWNIAEMVGSDTTVTINAISPDVPVLEPAHFTFVNNGSVTKRVVFNAAISSVSGSALHEATVPIGNKVDFDIRRNPLNGAVSYEAKVGDVNYNVTASGLSATWNPSDKSSTILLTNNNNTAELTGAQGTVRAFGGTNTGKRQATVRLEVNVTPGTSSSNRAEFCFGVCTASMALSSLVGSVADSASVRSIETNVDSLTFYEDGATVQTLTYSLPIAGDLYSILYDSATGFAWVFKNNVIMSGAATDPNTGSSPHLEITPGGIVFIALSLVRAGVGTLLKFTLLNEVENSVLLARYPNYPHWTA